MSTTSFNRPGVSDAFLAAAGVHRVTATEAKHHVGVEAAGLLIPFRKIGGGPVMRDGDGPHGLHRLRRDVPYEGQRYHQRAGSKAYAYIPHNLHELTAQTDLVVVEGEFKAAAGAEAGIAAVGICGICSALADGQLVPGLREVVQHMNVQRILFLGDSDTSLIFAFSREAVKLARALPDHITIALPRIGLDGPKGLDDCRQAKGAEFMSYWQDLVARAELVARDDTAEQLALRLFLRETPNALRIAAGQTT